VAVVAAGAAVWTEAVVDVGAEGVVADVVDEAADADEPALTECDDAEVEVVVAGDGETIATVDVGVVDAAGLDVLPVPLEAAADGVDGSFGSPLENGLRAALATGFLTRTAWPAGAAAVAV
jgi:hypothetical protein